MSEQIVPHTNTEMEEYTYLYQEIGGELNFPRYVKYPPEFGGWCDLYNEIEHLSESYVLRELIMGRVRTYKLDAEEDAQLIAWHHELDSINSIR